ncbi:HesA/MoeB/ThiF family protein [Methanoculleus thermophilus]|uniref:Adenylyltransferase and sulfurtransferase n=1 Tax=Methanoculleus thermophilus TaxID=2200 RepID=A0A1G8ZD48_9EURY|nr:HesA/MoeB/ThiF family protein [Methanoculleus thermophilus]SDK12938.1 adenylyltransferase and sulfurtransferase [Methanoculleus thermophilus]
MLTERERERYSRQILLFGEEGQERLKQAKVFIAGAGGLGCPIALYLAVAGVGEIRLVDRDVVDRTNLNRQVLHWEKDLGIPKVRSAEEKLWEVNPDVRIEALEATINEANVHDLAAGADLIVDAMDNFPTRYLLNREAIRSGVPLIHGAIRGFDGQVTTIVPGRTACLECIFPEAPPAEVFPVVGTTPGFIGLIQANEAIKYITGSGDLLAGRLLLWDGLAAKLETFAVERRSGCPACSREVCQ